MAEPRARERQRRLLEGNLVEFAKFGATNFAYRAGSLLANHAIMTSDGVERVGALSDIARLARARSVVDSLAACRCEAALSVKAVMILAGDGRVIAASPRQDVALPARALAGMYARVRSFNEPVLAVRATDERGVPMVMALARSSVPTSMPERFLLTAYDVDSIRRSVFGFIYNARPTLLPSVFGARRSNAAIVAVRVVLPGGTVLYQSPSNSRWSSVASVPLGFDTAATVQASLTVAAAREVMGVADEGIRRWWDLLATLGATLVIALIALLVRRSAALGRLRGEFTAAVSHELRTPLTEIMLYAELILTGRAVGAAPTTEAAQVILAEAKRLHNLVENVLIVARTDRRMLRVRVGPHALAPIVRTVVTGFEPLAAKRRVRVVMEVTDLPNVLCDPSAVAGVLLNLLENAVRYGPEAQTVIVRVTRGTGDVAVLEVDDAGAGIPTADRQRVKDPYVRLERDVEASTSGSGLGLAVVVSLVAEMHGTLTILDSTRGGTIMRVTLPFGPREDHPINL